MGEKEISGDEPVLNSANGIISYHTGGHAPLRLRTFLAQTASETGDQAVEIARLGHIIWANVLNSDKSSHSSPERLVESRKGGNKQWEETPKENCKARKGNERSNRSSLRQSPGDTGYWDGRDAHLLGTRRAIRQLCLFACTSGLNI